ncbi:BadF/BadG/BcrA/BcrD ATPase family protein [Symbiobacterium terraclitae]|uniref:BadF/BadG/BcrA/BcrD ATPase family protein n=1 Tax=Symbiobacterium terraclitae TaxID=557451 RepID=UPI0035B56EAC
MSLVLAVDGGGTKCLAVLVDAERGVVGSGRAGGCNPQSVGREQAEQALADAIAAACQGIPPGTAVRTAAFGLAGVDTPRGEEEGRRLALRALQAAQVTAAQVVVENDGLMALRGAAAGGRGLLVVAGTGSVVYAGDGERFVRAGGWGHRITDAGSAQHIAGLALAAAYRALDAGDPDTPLARALCAGAGVDDLYALHDWLYHPETGLDAVAALARAVGAAAEGGDPVAAAVLEQAGRQLADQALLAAKRVGLLDGGPFPVFLLGGVLQSSRRVRTALLERLRQRAPGALAEVPRFAPVYGAVIRALGGPAALDEGLRERLLASAVLQA